MRKYLGIVFLILCLSLAASSYLQAEGPVRIIATVLVASNEGADFNLVNDVYRDKLIQLFSYSSYDQIKEFSMELRKGKRNSVELLDDYELVLTLQDEEKGRILIQSVIRKKREIFLDTILSLSKPGVVFLGGPPIEGGDLILILESAD